MSNEVEDLIAIVGLEELHRTKEQLQPFIKLICEDNWIETIDDLKRLTDEQWAGLKLPLRLESAIRSRLQGVDNNKDKPSEKNDESNRGRERDEGQREAKATNYSDKPATSSSSRNEECDGYKEEPKVELSHPEDITDELQARAEVWLAELSSQDDQKVIFSSLQIMGVIICGVLKDPHNEVKRRVNMSSASYVASLGKFPSSVKLLEVIGFEKTTDNHLELPVAYLSPLHQLYSLVMKGGRDKGVNLPPLPPSIFNPFAPSISCTNPDYWRAVKKDEFQQTIAQETNRRNEVNNIKTQLQGSPESVVPVDARIYKLDECPKAQDPASRRKQFFLECDEEMGSQLSQDDVSRIKETLTGGPKFQSRSKQELLRLQKKAIFEQSCLRIVFPDKMVLEMNFAPATPLNKVQKEMEKFLTEECLSSSYVLFQTPPFARLNLNRTLAQEGLVPAAQVYFKHNDEGIKPAAYLKT